MSRLDQTKVEIEKAERQYDLNKAAELKYGKLTELERKLKTEESRLAEKQSGKRLLKEEVDEEDIAQVVSRWTGVPVSKLLEGEMQKLLHLEDELHQRVIGQDEAVQAVSEAVMRARSGLKDPNRPIGSFIFLRTHRRRQNRAGAGPGRISVRRRKGHDPDRYVRVPGKTYRCAAVGRPSRLHRLRRRGATNGIRPASSILCSPFRRN